MTYQAKDYSHLLGLKGFSDHLLKNHFKLYEGYVKNANQQMEVLKESYSKNEKVSDVSLCEIKRRLSFELNGVHLHEYYFENMALGEGGKLNRETFLYKKISRDFGSYAAWEANFKNLGMTRGVGWVVMIYDSSFDMLMNTWVDEHHLGHVTSATPVLVMDLWEHAMLLDYGSDREKYIDAFFHVVHWKQVSKRYEDVLEFQEIQQAA